MTSISEIIAQYGLSPDKVEQMAGYASLNYRISCGDHNYLLKHYRDPEDRPLALEEDRILSLLSEKGLPFELPYSLQPMQLHEDQSFSRLLHYIEGDLLSSAEMTPALIQDFGKASALLDQELMQLDSDSVRARRDAWDMKHTLLSMDKIPYIDDPQDRKLVSYYIDLYQHHVMPLQHRLRQSLIHSDLNDNNVITAGDRVRGFIDFGDIAHSPLIYEVAIAMTYLMMAHPDNPLMMAGAFLKGYHNLLPLLPEEIELLHLLIPSRLCVSLCHSAEKKAHGEATEYVLISEQPAWQLLRKWISFNPLGITRYIQELLDMPVHKPESPALLDSRQHYLGKALSLSYKRPIYMTGAAFQYMYDHEGHTYLDAYNNIPLLGHSHPRISQAISLQSRSLNTNTRYLYPQLTTLSAKLTAKLPDSLHKIYYTNSGSASSDLAIRFAQAHTGRTAMAILAHGYHGNTSTVIAISDYKHSGKGGGGTPAHIITLPLPKVYHGKFSTGEAYADHAIALLQKEIDQGNPPAALIAESISGCGGQVPLADGYLRKLHPFLKAHQILLIMDEVQTGFGRLGEYFWGYEMHGVTPDILILGKPMGNGHPVSAVVTTVLIDNSFATGMEYFSSFGGNPVSCTVAETVLDTLAEENLQQHALQVGQHLKSGLVGLQSRHLCIGDVRGMGLFIGVEFTDASGAPDTALAALVNEGLKQRYILVSTDGPHDNVLKIKPPLCFTQENADQLIAALDAVLS